MSHRESKLPSLSQGISKRAQVSSSSVQNSVSRENPSKTTNLDKRNSRQNF
jgi:hypothetical protein